VIVRSLQWWLKKQRTVRNRVGEFAFALLVVGVAFLIKWVLTDRYPIQAFMTFWPAVFMATLVGGTWSGLLALILSAGLGGYFFVSLEPIMTARYGALGVWFDAATFLVAGGFMVAITQGFRIAVVRLLEQQERNSVLLREVNHRVKNSLQLCVSMLQLQTREERQPLVTLHLQQASTRLSAIGRVHEQLYKGDSAEKVELDKYLAQLCADIRKTLTGASVARIDVNCDSISLSFEKVLPLALIVNELVTNALKYAHPDGADGTIRVSCVRGSDGYLVLSVEDDGVGLANDISDTGGGFGMKMIESLAAQIGARFEHTRANPGRRFVARVLV
jgi:two-component sensor histidine kinase